MLTAYAVDIWRQGFPLCVRIEVELTPYLGGFHTGDASSYDGVPVVERSIVLDEPIIYVSLNYRLHGKYKICPISLLRLTSSITHSIWVSPRKRGQRGWYWKPRTT